MTAWDRSPLLGAPASRRPGRMSVLFARTASDPPSAPGALCAGRRDAGAPSNKKPDQNGVIFQ